MGLPFVQTGVVVAVAVLHEGQEGGPAGLQQPVLREPLVCVQLPRHGVPQDLVRLQQGCHTTVFFFQK